MCSLFWKGMENDQGDLADIVRAGVGVSGGSMSGSTVDWQFPFEPTNLLSGIEEPVDDFGDPFLDMPDPLLHELDLAGSVFLNGANSATTTMTGLVKRNLGEDGSCGGGAGGNFLAQKIVGDEMKRSPSNIFSRMLQISPTTAKTPISQRGNSSVSQRGIRPPLDANDMIKSSSTVQISSPRNPGIKRRKSQAKQVVCIPAPAAANNRPSGEVVPSDLWAWRKYGQKPIKGSPYPRGYYRCSSSKGCSARKQVERSRNDPNMLVITYTSEHNHPWPTQRNALAGSIRSQTIKNNVASKNSPSTHTPKPTKYFKEQHKEIDADNSSISPITVGGLTTSGGTVKEEMGEIEKEKPMDIADHHEYDQGFNQSYRSLLLDTSLQSDDYFITDLGELEPDPLNLMSSQGFSAEKPDGERVEKALDPFNLFDWSGN